MIWRISIKQNGTGLGLIRRKGIVERHQGTISAKNNPTTFTVTIPKELTISLVRKFEHSESSSSLNDEDLVTKTR